MTFRGARYATPNAGQAVARPMRPMPHTPRPTVVQRVLIDKPAGTPLTAQEVEDQISAADLTPHGAAMIRNRYRYKSHYVIANSIARAIATYGTNAQPANRAFKFVGPGYNPPQTAYLGAAEWVDDASDSESEAEDETRTHLPPNAKKRKRDHESIFNFTKNEGRAKKKGKWDTKRDDTGKRKVPRVNNFLVTGSARPKLADDAKAIHDVLPEDDASGHKSRSFGATTVVCALVLREGKLRKLVFCNVAGVMSTALRQKAHQLGYHVVRALQAHAEGEMIQYLNTYKDFSLVEIGCDKEHCQECNFLMNKFFRADYSTQTGVSDRVFKNYFIPKPYERAIGQVQRPKESENWTVTGGTRRY